MIFNIVTNPHIEIRYNYFTRLLYHSLLDLGHLPLVSDLSTIDQVMNLVHWIQLFRSEGIREALFQEGNHYCLFSAEIFHGDGFNGAEFEDMDLLLSAVQRAAFVLTPFRSTVDHYRRINPRTVYTPLAYHPRLEDMRRFRTSVFDIAFFGSVAPGSRRERILRKLGERGLSLTFKQLDGTIASRDSQIAASRLCLNIGPEPPLDHASPRVLLLANNGICCASDRVGDPDGYLRFATVFEDDDALIDGCVDLVRSGRWAAAAKASYQAFRATAFVPALGAALKQVL